jgi:Family of unknown function (DUF6496)
MPKKETIRRAQRDQREGKSPSTQAGEFVHEEIHHVRTGKHGAASAKQAIAIGLSKARRAGVKLPPPKKGKASAETRKRARRDLSRSRAGQRRRPSPRRARAVRRALRQQPRSAASRTALARQARSSARKRSAAARSRAARKAARSRKSR